MNIVAWLDNLQRELTDAGQERVAQLIDRIPELTHDNKCEQVEALLPEALSAAKALKNPWLEIYFRHWEMRNRLSNNGEGESALAEVVSLLELSHRPENLDCPQSVCTTHDISGCYSNVDGPGWAEDRKAVCEETLSRVTPAWPCYTCLNREYVDALLDQGRYEEALARLDALESALKEHGEEEDSRLFKDRAVVFREQGRYQEALDSLNKSEAYDDFISQSEGNRTHTATLRAGILAHLDRVDEAWNVLPGWGDITPGDYVRWVDAACAIAEKRPSVNTWELGRLLQQAMDHADQVEAHRNCIETAEKHARLALARGSVWVAKRALAVAEKHLSRLRAPHGADSLLETLRKDIAAFTPPPLPVPVAELLQWMEEQEQRNPEQDAQWLLKALEEAPGNADFAVAAVSAMEACNAYDEAFGVFRTALKYNEEERGFLLSRLLLLYLDSGCYNEALNLAADIEGTDPGLTHWARARVAESTGQWETVINEVAASLEHIPDNLTLLRMAVNANRKLKRFTDAVAVGRIIAELVSGDEEALANARWELMTSASAAGDWAAVRAIAAELEIELEGENGIVEEDWGWLRLRFMEDGDWQEYFGLRTGPATARIISIATPGDIQHVKDLVVFDPSYVEALPEDEEERENYIVPHNVLHILEPAGYTAWICDGADPGEESFDALCNALEDQNYAVRIRQRGDYSIRNPYGPEVDDAAKGEDYDPVASGERLPGIYFAIASPPGASALDAYNLMLKLTEGWEHPLCLYGLAKAAGVDTRPQVDIIERYEL